MRYDSVVRAFLLKQQQLGEADVLGTWFTKEEGKIRAVIAAARRPQSRLSSALLPASCFDIRLVSRSDSGLFKLIGVSNGTVYAAGMTEQQAVLYSWFVEVVGKATPDHEPSLEIFSVAEYFFEQLAGVTSEIELAWLCARVQIKLLQAFGVGMRQLVPHEAYFFDVRHGGFAPLSTATDQSPVSPEVLALYISAYASPAGVLLEPEQRTSLAALVGLLEGAIEYYLDRPVRSFEFLNGIL